MADPTALRDAELAAHVAAHLATHVPGCSTYGESIRAAVADALADARALAEPEPVAESDLAGLDSE